MLAAMRPNFCNQAMLSRSAGGVLQDAMLSQQASKGLREVFATKSGRFACLGAPQGLQGTIIFSSIASLLGSSGQGNYAAANAAMDALAMQHQSQVGHMPWTLATASSA